MTTRTLHLAETLSLPSIEAVTQKYGFIGRSGSGKSYAAMKLAELFLGAGAQIIALDWVGIWWSLRLAANGRPPGFEHVYIFGGEHADVDLRPESGALMADLVVDKHISVVLDVMHFRKAERTRFATAFAEQFFHRKKMARTACHLFIEEAQAGSGSIWAAPIRQLARRLSTSCKSALACDSLAECLFQTCSSGQGWRA